MRASFEVLVGVARNPRAELEVAPCSGAGRAGSGRTSASKTSSEAPHSRTVASKTTPVRGPTDPRVDGKDWMARRCRSRAPLPSCLKRCFASRRSSHAFVASADGPTRHIARGSAQRDHGQRDRGQSVFRTRWSERVSIVIVFTSSWPFAIRLAIAGRARNSAVRWSRSSTEVVSAG